MFSSVLCRATCVFAAAIALSCLAATALGAQVLLRSPSLPREETSVYLERTGAQTREVRQVLSLHEGTDGRWLELRSDSDDTETYARLDVATLSPTYTVVTQRGTDAVIRRTTEILQASPRAETGELVVSDYTALPFTLRALPWDSFRTARLVALGASGRSSAFSFQLTLVGRETVEIGGVRYDCYKVQLGVNGFWGAFVGKSSYWYAVAPAHYLVRSESLSAGPGSPATVTELQRYAAR